jgi:hypothetical protein
LVTHKISTILIPFFSTINLDTMYFYSIIFNFHKNKNILFYFILTHISTMYQQTYQYCCFFISFKMTSRLTTLYEWNGRMWKVVVMAYFKVLLLHFPAGYEKNNANLSQIQTQDLPDMKQEC